MDKETQKRCCYVCKHHVDFLGEKGYCKIYRHETFLPEDACPLFEPCDEKNSVVSENIVNEKVPQREDRNSNFKKFLIIVSLFSCIVLTVIELFFGVNLGMMVALSDEISSLVKFLVIFFGTFFMILLLLIFFRLSKRSTVSQIFLILFTVATLLLVSLNNSLWLTVYQYASDIADKYLI